VLYDNKWKLVVAPGLTVYLFMQIFTARRVCIARTMPWQEVRPSVRLNVRHTPVLSLNGYTYPQSFFTILVFPHKTGWQYSDGDPLTGASNTTAV